MKIEISEGGVSPYMLTATKLAAKPVVASGMDCVSSTILCAYALLQVLVVPRGTAHKFSVNLSFLEPQAAVLNQASAEVAETSDVKLT